MLQRDPRLVEIIFFHRLLMIWGFTMDNIHVARMPTERGPWIAVILKVPNKEEGAFLIHDGLMPDDKEWDEIIKQWPEVISEYNEMKNTDEMETAFLQHEVRIAAVQIMMSILGSGITLPCGEVSTSDEAGT